MITVEVTEEDIEHGKPQDCATCPVARAVSRVTGRHAFVTYVGAYLCDMPFLRDADGIAILHPDEHDHDTYRLPIRVGEWIRKFDCRAGLEFKPNPISFVLTPTNDGEEGF